MVGERLTVAARPLGVSGAVSFASPKSSTFTVPSGAQLDVRGLQIAMDDALVVRRLERVGDLPRDRHRLVERNRPLSDAVRERRPLDQLQHQRLDTLAGFFEAVNRGDVRMVERGEHLRLAPEPREPLRIGGEGSGRIFSATSRFSVGRARDTPLPCRRRPGRRGSRTGQGGCR